MSAFAMTASPTLTPESFRFPGVLNSKELLVAEALQSRAWGVLDARFGFGTGETPLARDRLGRIVLRLMAEGNGSMTELTGRAIEEFTAGWAARSGL